MSQAVRTQKEAQEKMKTLKILVTDPLGKNGMDELRKEQGIEVVEKPGIKPEDLKKIIGDYDAILIRSGTKLTKDLIEAADRLQVIGRAGVGVDNVDVEAASKRGIIVMNTPEGNTISTAEHTFSMLMALARNIPQANQSVKGSEWKRQEFLGTELNGKVLAIFGFGRIGREVAKRAMAFNMKVVVYDRFIPKEKVEEFGAEYHTELKSLLGVADFITVHTPLTPETKYILNSQAFKLCKKGVRVVNCARGGIIEETALIEAIQSGIVAGAALDVFEKEPPAADNPLLKMKQVIVTPHLGAATQEAQENVAIEVAKQVVDFLQHHVVRNAVNHPNLDGETFRVLRPWLELAEKIGSFHVQYFGGSITKVDVRYGGEVTRYSLAPLNTALVKGLLTPICGDTVNFVNAPAVAKERGIVLESGTSTKNEDFTNYIEVEVNTNGVPHRIMGTLFGNKLPRIVNIDEFWGLDIDPKDNVLVIKNEDQPGVVGKLGTILGENKINIAEMSLARVIKKGKKNLVLTTLNTDSDVPEKVISEIKKFSPIQEVKVVKL